MKGDRDIIVKIRFVANPQMPDVTDEEISKIIFGMEHNHNILSKRRIHINKMEGVC